MRPVRPIRRYRPGDRFVLPSSTRSGRTYPMVVTPEGFVVHDGEGCEGEQFRGVRGCYHSRESERFVTQQGVTPYQPAPPEETSVVPQRMEFTEAQLRTIANVICVDANNQPAPPDFVELFLAACRHSGLDPFLKQIYALKIQGRWTMFVGIDGYRVISERTGLDQGMDGPQWSDDGVHWFDFPMTDEPAFARVGIWRKGIPRPFVAVVSLKAKRVDASPQWQKDAPGMLAKCAESLARRRAFPADMAVIPSDAIFEEPGEAPLTRAEIPEGSWRTLADEELADVTDDNLSDNSGAAPDSRQTGQDDATTGDKKEEPPAGAVISQDQYMQLNDWLLSIENRHGKAFQMETIVWLRDQLPYAKTEKGISLLEIRVSDYDRVLAELKARGERRKETTPLGL